MNDFIGVFSVIIYDNLKCQLTEVPYHR